MNLLKINYNSPTTLTYTFLSLAILLISSIIPSFMNLFTLSGFNFLHITSYFQLISHSLGHADFGHYFGNFMFILLVGPIVEEKYGSVNLLIMLILTSLVTGILYCLFFTGGVLGASGNVFMLIILSSFLSYKKDGGIPLSLILTMCLFLGQEVVHSFAVDNTSQFSHIIGGLCGTGFGYLFYKQ